MNLEAQKRLEKVSLELTDFQKATVEVVSDRFISKHGLHGRMLVADEVGLGKTVVAKGVIASLLLHRLKTAVEQPLRVAYICSNLALAQENAHKLAVFKDKDAENWTRKLEFGRLAELGVQQDPIPAAVLVEICSLTPATSFTLTQGGGNARERYIIWQALCNVPYMEATPELLAFFQDGVGPAWDVAKRWFDSRSLEPATLTEFGAKMGHQPDLADEVMATASELGLSCRSWRTLLRGVVSLPRKSALSKQQAQLIRLTRTRIREMFVESCAGNLHADLFILDEFQRFSDLVTGDAGSDDDEPTDEKKISEQQIVARRVLHEGDGYATLLLSATPFKALSHTADEDEGKAHANELEELLKYLTKSDEACVARYRSGRDALFTQILNLPERRLRPGSLDREPKRLVEELLRAYICRTERTAVEPDIERIFHNVEVGFAVPSIEEIQEFICLDKLAGTLNQESGGLVHADIMKFHKAAPWCLSFLSGYQLRDSLQRYRDQPQVAAAIKATSSAWIPYEKLQEFRVDLSRNAPSKRFQAVLEAAAPAGAEKLLWVPPAMPYYAGSGPYADRDGFTKTLLFSSLVLTPRALSALVSYECERRLVTATRNKRFRYFSDSKDSEASEDRKVRKDQAWVFRFDEGARSPGWSLVYPSKRLSSFFIPNQATSLADLRKQVRTELAGDFRRLTARYGKGAAIRGAAWYTLAPVLLDLLSDDGQAYVEAWKAAIATPSRNTGTQKSHVERLLELTARDQFELGPAPSDLLDYLVDLAIAGPGVCLVRSLGATWPILDGADPEGSVLLKLATDAALSFVHKMNRIESQRVLRAVCGKDKPWMAVAKYAAMGNLQAVIDEYMHMLKSVHGTMQDSVEAFSSVLATGAVSVTAQVSLPPPNRVTAKDVRFHCHYAVPLGNQKSTDEKGISRITNARAAFNSPFWPFMLNSTSVGQEGLDFHWYCRRIVHWNLPSNPIDLEQREGRINRYKSLVVRQRVAEAYGKTLRLPKHGDVWSTLFDRATSKNRRTDLVPFWHFPMGSAKIERLVPAMPFSSEVSRLDEILRILSLYRLSFGQPRQQELVENLLKRELTTKELAEIRDALLIDLAPVSYQRAHAFMAPRRRFAT